MLEGPCSATLRNGRIMHRCWGLTRLEKQLNCTAEHTVSRRSFCTTPRPLSTLTRRRPAAAESRRQLCCVCSAREEEGQQDLKDEPEAAVLLVACGIGLCTGAGVVLFNDAILRIRDLAFLQAPVQSVAWGIWARQLSIQSSLLIITIPPTVGGLTVGLFRYLAGGFGDPPPLKEGKKPARSRRLGALSLVDSVRDLGTLAKQRIQSNKVAREEDEERRTRLDSGGAASTSDPGSRDFLNEDVERGTAWGGDEVPSTSSPSSNSLQGRSMASLRRQLRAGIAPILRTLAAAITLGSGCSLGPEGPSVEIGRSAARALGRLLRSKQRRLLPLLAAGSGAGVAAGFNAPISGVFFAVESVLQSEPRNSETEARNSSGLTVAMVLLACVTAAIVSQAGLGESPTFRVPLYQLQSTWEFPLVLLLGSACGLVSLGFSYCSEVSSNAFKRLNPEGSGRPLVWVLMPAIGGLCTGVVALAFPEILYQGYGNVNALLELKSDDYAPSLLLQMLGAKIFATAVCRGSGLVGGIYAPSIFMGAALGSAFGGIAQAFFGPTGLVVAAPAAYALVGVAGVLAANCQVPLTAVLLLFELTHDYFIIVPTLAAVGISYWTASLPIAAEISARLRATAGPDVGAGSVTSVDGDEFVPGEPLINQIRVAATSLASVRSRGSKGGRPVSERDRQAETLQRGRIISDTEQPSLPLSPGLKQSTTQSIGDTARINVRTVNGADSPKAEGTAKEALKEVVQDLTAECAVQGACVMPSSASYGRSRRSIARQRLPKVSRETPLAEALVLLDESSQTAALVLDDNQMVTGVLTRDKILTALEAETECRVSATDGASDPDGAQNCTVELAVGSATISERE